MSSKNLTEIIAECDSQLKDLMDVAERNRDLYIEGYSDSKTLNECTRKIEQKISRVTKKRTAAIRKCQKLGIIYNVNTYCIDVDSKIV